MPTVNPTDANEKKCQFLMKSKFYKAEHPPEQRLASFMYHLH